MPARFSVVDDYVLRGGEPSEDDLHLLKDVWGVKNILSLDDSVAKRISNTVKDLGLNHVIFPIHHIEGISDLKDNINHLLQVQTNACEECGSDPGVNIDCSLCNSHGRTFVHCYHGKDRTGVAVALYRIGCGWEPEKAYEEALSFGMGQGLSEDVKKAYKETLLGTDVSDATDAVIFSRNLPYDRISYDNSSFAPNVDSNPMLRQASIIVYGPENKKRIPGRWSLKPGNGLIKATVNANVRKINNNLNQDDVVEGIANKESGILFNDYLAVIDPRILSFADENDALPLNGVISNYDGLAPYSFPGSGGLAFDSGGYGGYVQLPMSRH